MMDFGLEDRVAVVTGAGAGTGLAIAHALASAGVHVVLVARTRAAVEDAAAAIRAAGGRAEARACDVTDRPAVRALFEALPRLDILVNNAGTNRPEPFVSVRDEDLDAVVDLNMRATFVVAQAAVRKMLSGGAEAFGGAVVINVSSQMGHVGAADRTVYCMTKHAVEGLTRSMAVELAPRGIRVVSLAPTFVDTPLIRRIVDTPAKRDALVGRIPMGRMADEDDVAAAAVHLASPHAGMVTGTSILVDGGWTAQ
ncbi:SDR family NAD(P)-dependent oxidoreductase [Xanthobacter agilis]|uniref:SDR family NAD(P)-dependent oxidoreductase n=1 Tax=Xanthobacter agilis TaxID=47492 RepID=UPI00372CA74E